MMPRGVGAGVVRSFLDAPFGPEERSALDFSEPVAQLLERTYRVLWARDRSDVAVAEARGAVERLLPESMTRRQRLKALYVLATALAAEGQYWRALEVCGQALDLARELEDRLARVRLLQLRATWKGALSLVREAAEDYEACLTLLEELARDGQPSEARSWLRILAPLSGFTFYLGNYARAEALVQQGRRLVPQAPEARLEAAALEWTQAQLFHWRGEPALAVLHAGAAAEAFATLDAAPQEARLRLTAAEAALTWAESMPEGGVVRDRDFTLRRANAHIRRALAISREARDAPGVAMARLVAARYRRLRGLRGDRIGVHRAVVRAARREGDLVLELLALKSLGDELAAQGRYEPEEGDAAGGELPDSALGCWQAALALARRVGLPALEVWPRRALARYEGLHAGTGGDEEV